MRPIFVLLMCDLLKLIHNIAKPLSYKHFSAGVPYVAPYAHKYIQVYAINVLKTNQNTK